MQMILFVVLLGVIFRVMLLMHHLIYCDRQNFAQNCTILIILLCL